MSSCWLEDAESRPSFSEIMLSVSRIMQEESEYTVPIENEVFLQQVGLANSFCFKSSISLIILAAKYLQCVCIHISLILYLLCLINVLHDIKPGTQETKDEMEPLLRQNQKESENYKNSEEYSDIQVLSFNRTTDCKTELSN